MNIFEICKKYFLCPLCKGTIIVKNFENGCDGYIECTECLHRYIIINNIPIMVDFAYVGEEPKRIFFSRYPQLKSCFNSKTQILNEVKLTQIGRWDKQYSTRFFMPERTTPETRKVHIYNILSRNSIKKLHRVIANRRSKFQNQIFLDVGCGVGGLSSIASENFQLYFGMDISFNSVLQSYSEVKAANCIFFVGDAENIPLKNEVVDVTASRWLFEHLDHPQQCSSEMFRILKKGGVAYVDTNHKVFFLTYRWFQMKMRPNSYWKRMEEAGHSHDRFFDRNNLSSIFFDCGFRKVDVNLCYFLWDMVLHLKIMTPVYSFLRENLIGVSNMDSEKDIKKHSIPTPLEIKPKTTFHPSFSKKDHIKNILNVFMNGIFFLLIIDRWLEFFNKGESLIIIAQK